MGGNYPPAWGVCCQQKMLDGSPRPFPTSTCIPGERLLQSTQGGWHCREMLCQLNTIPHFPHFVSASDHSGEEGQPESPGENGLLPFLLERAPLGHRGRREPRRGPEQAGLFISSALTFVECSSVEFPSGLHAHSSGSNPHTALLCLPSVNIQANRMSYKEEWPWKQ